jgi:hypothetical protein
MPISSSEIAALNGGYQQQTMSQMQYASSIGQGNIYGGMQQGGGQADQMMSKGMNHAAGIGVPLAAAGMSLMGLDPFSIGLKAAGAAMPAMGLGGAAAVGAGVALPLMAGLGAAKYAGSQMMEGASQQSSLNNTLRGSFNFRNSAGGQGFQRQDMTEIGTMVRGMSEQFGSGGEITGFKELTTLAGKMGSMGFAQGVRDVKEFSSKFKEMVTTLKGMAKDLGTTLEGAMEFAQAAKGSGVFGMGNMAKFTGQVRGAAVSGGLAVSEVTGAASIGSQVARSIGGLGSQGAGAGIRTIGQIGNAQQMGVLSEKDIYNVTGLTGAEGRQAYAASSMQKTGEFLQTSKGRYTLAALAGKDGSLDEAGVQELLAGGMDIGETKRRAGEMKKNVGRANFIRNEGRLRGAAMERIGAFLPALQLKEWASGKGIDINNMDDRSMLFAQRQLHMGRDEVDQAVKMANALPQIAQRMQRSAEDDTYFQKLAQERKQQGIEGVQNRFDQAKEKINNKLQAAGQNLFNSGSEAIDRWLNKMTGTYEHAMTEKADNAFRAMGHGGASSKLDMAIYMGKGMGGGAERISASAFNKGGAAGSLGAVLGGVSRASEYKAAGYNISDTSNSRELQMELKRASDISKGAQRTDVGFGNLGDVTQGVLRDAYVGKLAGLRGAERVEGFRQVLADQAKGGNAEAAKMLQRFDHSSDGSQAALVNTTEGQLGISDKTRLSQNAGLPGERGAGGTTQNGYADTILGSQNQTAGRAVGGALGGMMGLGVMSAPLAAAGAWLGGKVQSSLSGDDARRSGLNQYLKSEEAQSRAFSLFGGAGKKASQDMQKSMENELMDLNVKGEKEGARATGIASQLAAQEYARALADPANGGKVPDKEIQRLTEKYGANGIKTAENLTGAFSAWHEAASKQQAAVTKEESERIRTRARKEIASNKERGFGDAEGRMTAYEGMTKEGKAAITQLSLSTHLQAEFTGAPGQMEKIQALEEEGEKALAGLSDKERQQISEKYAGSSLGQRTAMLSADEKRFEKAFKRGTGREAATGALGITLTKEEKKRMNIQTAEGFSALQTRMVDELVSPDTDTAHREALRKEVGTLLTATAKKDKAGAARAMESIQSDDTFQKHQKEKENEDENKNPQVREQKQTNKLLEIVAKKSMTPGELAAAIKAGTVSADGATPAAPNNPPGKP